MHKLHGWNKSDWLISGHESGLINELEYANEKNRKEKRKRASKMVFKQPWTHKVVIGFNVLAI